MISNQFDLISFGINFILNPDLIDKIKSGKELIKYDIEMLIKM
jgi:2,4-dienoyl-CoA reductase-like NADH-dependent reductase (Old Yellow Enzyme family)